jgi:hypothetical protein
MKIIITENQSDKLINKIKNAIDKVGLSSTIKMVGGFDILTKILGENSIPEYIYKYLSENVYPDYGWVDKMDYKNEVDRYGTYVFEINDNIAYEYFAYTSKLVISSWLYYDLDVVFMDYNWKEIFKKWFQDNTGLKVDRVV